jgi:spore germination protein YaaH
MSRMRRQALSIVALLSTLSLLSVGAPPTVSAASANAAARQDPTIGPLTRDEARHLHDALRFTPAQGPIRPLRPRSAVGGAAAAATTSTGPPQREVFGFAPYWELSQNANWNYSLLSTVGYFGLGIYANGTLNQVDQGWTGWNSQDLATIINGAHQVGAKVVAVIKPSNAPNVSTADTVNQIVTSPSATQQAINNAMALMASSQHIDGINVDFEGSSNGYPSVQSGFTNFMRQLSQTVHQQYPSALVTADTYTGSASWDGGIFKIGDLAPVVDYLFVMAYDMSFGNMPAGGAQAGPNAPLNGWTYNDTLSVSQYLGKAPASKVVLGVPYYGYKWCTVDDTAYSAATRDPSGSIACPDGSGTPSAVTYSQSVADFQCAPQLKLGWDATASSPWAAWFSPATGDPCNANRNSWREAYYENSTSLGLKYDLVNSNNLRGTGIWALGYDGSQPELWNEIAQKFVNWKDWAFVGGSLSTGPAAASQGSGKLDVFAAGQNRVLYHKSFDGTAWSDWQPLGGQLSSDPAAVSWGSGRIDVFARGMDSVLYHKAFTGSWSDWESLGGQLSSAPAVSSWGANRLDVFAAGLNRVLYHKIFDGTSWSDWQPLGGQLSSAPGAVSAATNRIDVVARGMEGALYHRSFDGTSWTDWESLGGSLSTAGAISSRSSTQLDVFAAGRNGILYYKVFDGASWSPWQWLGGRLSSSPASVSWAGNRIDVFARGANLALYQKSFISP